MSFGEKLASIRKEHGMSQEDLASELNVSRQAVSKWESNNAYPETEKIIAICKLYNISMDELIGLTSSHKNKDKSKNILNNINKYFEKLLDGIKLFFNMTGWQKLRCLSELIICAGVLTILFLIINSIILFITQKILSIIPWEILYVIQNTIEGVLILVFLILGIYLLSRFYKVRYLDCYNNYIEKNREIINELDTEKVNIKEEKIIIRDAKNDKSFNIIKSIFKIFLNVISLFISFIVIIAFVTTLAIIIFLLFFVKSGLIILYFILLLTGGLIILYIIIEILIKCIFDMKQRPLKLFIMFISSILLIGVSFGLLAVEFTNFKIISEDDMETILLDTDTINVDENLVLEFLSYYNTEIIYEDRENIYIEYYASKICDAKIEGYTYEEIYPYNKFTYYIFSLKYNNFNTKDFLKIILKDIENKELKETYECKIKNIKIHISENNYNKIKHNQKIYYSIYYK